MNVGQRVSAAMARIRARDGHAHPEPEKPFTLGAHDRATLTYIDRGMLIPEGDDRWVRTSGEYVSPRSVDRLVLAGFAEIGAEEGTGKRMARITEAGKAVLVPLRERS